MSSVFSSIWATIHSRVTESTVSAHKSNGVSVFRNASYTALAPRLDPPIPTSKTDFLLCDFESDISWIIACLEDFIKYHASRIGNLILHQSEHLLGAKPHMLGVRRDHTAGIGDKIRHDQDSTLGKFAFNILAHRDIRAFHDNLGSD